MLYRISLDGCDDSTIFEMELNEDEFKLLQKIMEIANKTSTYRCMPSMEVELID